MPTAPAARSAVDFFDLPLGAVSGAVRDAIVLVDAGQNIVAVNESAAQMFGYAQAALVGQPLSRLIPQEKRLAHDLHVQAFVQSGRRERRALGHAGILGLRADGQTFPAEVSITRVELPVDGRPQPYYVAMLGDLSAERALRAEVLMLNERLRTVLELSPAAIWIVDGEQVVYANRSTVDLFGVPDRSHLVGRHIGELLRPEGAGLPYDPAALPAAVGGTVLRPDGQTREVEVATTALPDHGQTVLQMVITDVTQRSLLAQEQSWHRLELRRLAASVVEAREEERRRIARELHDELGQRLTALKMEIASLRSGDPRCDEAGRITGMLEMVDSTVAALRRIAADLRPLMLDDLGLNAAIEWLARDAARRMDMEVTVSLGSEDPPLAAGADIALYRMVQEALNNVGRHAHATDVRIGLRQDGDELVLTVHDNGRGFPERSMRQEGRFGLVGIRERSLMLGGRLEIDNPPGGGGRITVRLPLQPGVEAADRTR
jgi:PAS domain S-box-containing protein